MEPWQGYLHATQAQLSDKHSHLFPQIPALPSKPVQLFNAHLLLRYLEFLAQFRTPNLLLLQGSSESSDQVGLGSPPCRINESWHDLLFVVVVICFQLLFIYVLDLFAAAVCGDEMYVDGMFRILALERLSET